MEKIPANLTDIFSSEKRIFEVVSKTESPFTPKQILLELENQKTPVPTSMLLTCLKALHYRGYLKEVNDVNLKKPGRGRPEIRYTRTTH
jgi:c-di-GMP-related signal transduction protein